MTRRKRGVCRDGPSCRICQNGPNAIARVASYKLHAIKDGNIEPTSTKVGFVDEGRLLGIAWRGVVCVVSCYSRGHNSAAEFKVGLAEARKLEVVEAENLRACKGRYLISR